MNNKNHTYLGCADNMGNFEVSYFYYRRIKNPKYELPYPCLADNEPMSDINFFIYIQDKIWNDALNEWEKAL